MAGDAHARWLQPRLEASMWWCGDEVCDCYQPRIDRLTPNMDAGFPWIRREEVWRGTFATDGEERRRRVLELRRAARRYAIPFDAEGLIGVRHEPKPGGAWL